MNETVVGDGRRVVRRVGELSIVEVRDSFGREVSGTKLKIHVGGREPAIIYSVS